MTIPGDFPDVTGAYVRVRVRMTEQQAREFNRHALEQSLLDAGACKVQIDPPDVVDRVVRARAHGEIEHLAPLETVRLWVSAQEFERAEQIVSAAEPYLEPA